MSPEEKILLKFDYAYKWFEFHAIQRTTMFNYFLLIVGILAKTYIDAEGKGVLLFIICVVGAFTAGAFIVLDKRNYQLVKLGQEVIRDLETSNIFLKTSPKYILEQDADSNKRKWLKHSFFIPLMQTVVLLIFLLGMVPQLIIWL